MNAKNLTNGSPHEKVRKTPLVVLVGNPNVGKSALFNLLTGSYATVSNYSGTTVEITRGKMHFNGFECELMDTPGLYSLNPLTEEERVARHVLLTEKPDLVIQVIDAKNLERMLHLTLQLTEGGLPLIIVLNMMDEAESLGLSINSDALSRQLHIPVVCTSAALKRGLGKLRKTIYSCLAGKIMPARSPHLYYPEILEAAVCRIAGLIQRPGNLYPRLFAVLMLQEDREILGLIKENNPESWPKISKALALANPGMTESYSMQILKARNQRIKSITAACLQKRRPSSKKSPFLGLGELMIHPLWGWPFLLVILYCGLYQFVGVFGAGTVVDFLENKIFLGFINPWFEKLVIMNVPWPVIHSLLVGEYGMLTLGLRYAIAIILPIVGTFFFAFAVLEDTGYLPRLALLLNNAFSKLGLNGKAVIPITLGLGCGTMATLVARILETPREKTIATILLSLAVPCSAQLGIIMSILAAKPRALLLWVFFVLFVFLFAGYLAAQILPGQRPVFCMELPPLRIPRLSNIMAKTLARMRWYFSEIFPLFITASVLLWLGQITGAFSFLIRLITPAVRWIGLPDRTASVLLFGFFRRDFGAAGLYDMAPLLTIRQLLVISCVLTLFIPCIAQLTMIIKERGVMMAAAIASFIFPFAFLCGKVINIIVLWWNLQ